MSPSPATRTSALILAGGQGSRLGGRDKGLMPWEGQPVAAHLAALVRPLCTQLIISCNRNLPVYARWADLLVRDDEPNFPGPMAGLLAGLGACTGDRLLVVPCDLPRLDRSLLTELLDRAQSATEQPWLVRTGEHWQPLVCVLPRTSLPGLQGFWDAGGRAPLRWLLGGPHGVLQLAEDDPRLTNANHASDWAAPPRT